MEGAHTLAIHESKSEFKPHNILFQSTWSMCANALGVIVGHPLDTIKVLISLIS